MKRLLLIITVAFLFNCTKLKLEDLKISNVTFTQNTNYIWVDYSFDIKNTSTKRLGCAVLWFDAYTENDNTYNMFSEAINIGGGESKSIKNESIIVNSETVIWLRYDEENSYIDY
jgi:hypothetical protein